jgi:predicted small secreted protein
VTDTVTLASGQTGHQEIQMMKLRDTVGAALVMGALLLALSGCQKEGPAEQAGKAVDQTVDKAGQQIEKAGDSIQDAAKGDKK